jgi:hypothetical protein
MEEGGLGGLMFASNYKYDRIHTHTHTHTKQYFHQSKNDIDQLFP